LRATLIRARLQAKQKELAGTNQSTHKLRRTAMRIIKFKAALVKILYGTSIACKKCKQMFDKETHNGLCPFCGENNN
jgi:Zn finger protein HypA/HybF involved in hydrogenase expression